MKKQLRILNCCQIIKIKVSVESEFLIEIRLKKATQSPIENYYNKGSPRDDETTIKEELSPIPLLDIDESPIVKTSPKKKTLKSFRKFKFPSQSVGIQVIFKKI